MSSRKYISWNRRLKSETNKDLLFWLKIISIFVTFGFILGFTILPYFSKKIKEDSKFLSLVNAFSGGLFFGVAFFELLPEANESLLEGNPDLHDARLSYYIAFVSYSLILFIEKLAFNAEAGSKKEENEAKLIIVEAPTNIPKVNENTENKKEEENSPTKEKLNSPVKEEENNSPVKEEENNPNKAEEENNPNKEEENSPVKEEENNPNKEENNSPVKAEENIPVNEEAQFKIQRMESEAKCLTQLEKEDNNKGTEMEELPPERIEEQKTKDNHIEIRVPENESSRKLRTNMENNPEFQNTLATKLTKDCTLAESITDKEKAKPIILLISLGFDGFFEGVTLSLMDQIKELIFLLVALCAHKWAESLSLGISLCKIKYNLKKHLLFSFIYAIILPIGLILGIVINSMNNDPTIVGVFLSVSAGVFVYFACSEVIVEEFEHEERKYKKFLLYIAGALLCAGLSLFEYFTD